ncbi:GtrA family protein [Ferruginibacter lapsinanis]|uniref:GtrA family protein n=1 Tax=Ferruginibacter lapsinanis TaxID=563172 RepID=UPI001E2CA305|nr:GtrA family protein [Ferruginibacter lapsinanis]UEG49174.1 GtrA family protein [Ferruginibacter lapsinanis]
MKNKIVSVIDSFYPLFKRIMPLQTFRYAACGGSNMVLNFSVFTILYHFFVAKYKIVHLGFYSFESYSLALFLAGVLSFFVGFFLNKYIVFEESNLKGRIQLFRYFVSFTSNLFINYLLLKFFVTQLHLYPVLAQLIVTIIVVIISYITQRKYTFTVKPDKAIDS